MNWASSSETIDSLIRDYLSQRGFSNSLKSFDNDLKNDKDKGFKAEKVLQQILSYVSSYDLDSLHSYWNHLDARTFCRLEQTHLATVKKMEYNLYKFYLINCMQNGKRKECFEFFEKFSQELSSVPEWKDWFSFPFTAQPENNKIFANHFTKAWSDTFLVSLHNLLSVTFACMPPPLLYDMIRQDKVRLEQLEREVESLKEMVADVSVSSTNKVATPNYVKSMGVPGSLNEQSFVSVQPQKKKTLGFPFSTKKNNSLAGNKSKGATANSPKASARPAEAVTASPEVTTAAPTAVQDVSGGQKTKKLSGYHMQRKELMGNAVSAQKQYQGFTGRNVSNSPPIASNIPSPAPQASTPLNAPSSSPPQSNVSNIPLNSSTEAPVENGTAAALPEKETDFRPVDENTKTDTFTPPTDDQPKHTHLLLSKDEYHEHHSAIIQGRFNTTGETVASCDNDGIVKIWRYEPTPTTVATIMYRSRYLSLEWYKASNNLLLLGSSAGNLRLYDTNSKQIQLDVSCHLPHVAHIASASDGSLFAISSSSSSDPAGGAIVASGRLELWRLTNNHAEMSTILFDSKINDVRSIAFHPKGDRLLSGDAKGGLMIYDIQSGKSILNKLCHEGPVYSLHATDRFIYTLGADGKFLGWDLLNMNQPMSFPIHQGAAGPFELSGYGGYRQIHKPSGGKLFAFEPEGRHILTCDGNASPIYDVDVGKGSLSKEMTLVGHRSPVVSVDWISAFNCGHCLGGSMDGKIHVTTLLNQ